MVSREMNAESRLPLTDAQLDSTLRQVVGDAEGAAQSVLQQRSVVVQLIDGGLQPAGTAPRRYATAAVG
jgi:hypothetical protein